ASAVPIKMPRGAQFTVSVSTILAATVLGGPAAGTWVALLGTTELREIRGRIPWYGTLANHAVIVLPAAAAGLLMLPLGVPSDVSGTSSLQLASPATFIAAMLGAAAYIAINAGLTAVFVALRTNQAVGNVLAGDGRSAAASFLSLAPIGWLMAQI